ncbi:hypothetical protein SAMN05660313_01450 [Cellulophaga fucicola]|uniref:DUF3592 domain-containing protein n=2 Tax=Cellulophaga fucicola TaxID=76595 RepID=A0A1K1NXM9_9FLAO|nr:hypothetical protein SAMN05660313_01450 [Cellulophaga fucicola]
MFYKPVICFLILGSFLKLIGIKSWAIIKGIKNNGIECVGKILFYEADKEGYKTPIIEFKVKNGQQIKKKPYYYASTNLSKIKSYKDKINEPVTVLYNKNNHLNFDGRKVKRSY